MPSDTEPDHSRPAAARTAPGTAFVTGAGGFLGAAAAAALRRAGWRVAGIGHRPQVGAPPEGCWIEGDVEAVRLGEALGAMGPPELVIHAAGGASVAASVTDPEGDRRRSLGSLQALLGFLRSEAPQARLVFPSSAAVYGQAEGALTEDRPLQPVSPYGRHKAEAEALIAQAATNWGLDAVIVRFFSAYGPGLRKQLLWELGRRLASGEDEVVLAGSGQETRDFIHVDDAVDLMLGCAALSRGPAPLTLNGGTGAGITVREAGELLARALGATARIGFSGEPRTGDPVSLVADTRRASEIGFAAQVPFADGIRRYAAWLKRQGEG